MQINSIQDPLYLENEKIKTLIYQLENMLIFKSVKIRFGLRAVLCCVLFVVGIGDVAAFMNIIGLMYLFISL
jgi:hypothetical protein